MAKQTTRQETKAAVRETLLGGLDLEDESTPDQGGGEPAASEEPGTPAEPVATPDVETPGAGQPDAAAPAAPATQGFLEKVRELGYEGDSEAEAANGAEVLWRDQVAARLLKLQKSNGSWVNPEPRWWEADPVLVTSYAVMTLEMLEWSMP